MKPIFFKNNRVRRVYKGGLLFDSFFGDGSTDGFFPEEWIASSVRALNRDMASENEGISVTEDGELFSDVLAASRTEMLGSSGKMRILVKMLDSAIRLPAQAHPDKAFSLKHFGSEYGKTESWIVIATRPDAKIYFGFKEGVSEEIFREAITASLTDKDAMERLMEYREPSIGDVYLVPAKTVHAIGAGCLILEVQEPTDFTVQPEHWCGDYQLNENEMYIGLAIDDAIGCFSFDKAPDARLTPKIVRDDAGVRVERLITPRDTDCFVINRFTLTDGEIELAVNDSYAVYIVTDGIGELVGDSYRRSIKKGDYFFMPAALMGKFRIKGNLELVECY